MSSTPKPDPAPLAYFDPGDGRRIAYRHRPANAKIKGPTLLFLPGYASDMEGTKATEIDAFAAVAGLAFLRLDYSGTGSSGGDFAEGTLDRWLDEVVVGDRHAGRRAGDADRFVDGRLAGAACGAASARTGSRRWSASPPRRLHRLGNHAGRARSRWSQRPGSNGQTLTADRPRSPTPASLASGGSTAPAPQPDHARLPSPADPWRQGRGGADRRTVQAAEPICVQAMSS